MSFFLRSQQAFQPSFSLTVEALLTTLVGLNERMVEAVADGWPTTAEVAADLAAETV